MYGLLGMASTVPSQTPFNPFEMQSWLKDAAKSLWSLAAKLFKTPKHLKNKKGEKKLEWFVSAYSL